MTNKEHKKPSHFENCFKVLQFQTYCVAIGTIAG